jgi:hypothetical protein
MTAAVPDQCLRSGRSSFIARQIRQSAIELGANLIGRPRLAAAAQTLRANVGVCRYQPLHLVALLAAASLDFVGRFGFAARGSARSPATHPNTVTPGVSYRSAARHPQQ